MAFSSTTTSQAGGARPIDIALPAEQRHAIADRLGCVGMTHRAKTHGSMDLTGPMFGSPHLKSMDEYTEPWSALDEFVERIRAFGNSAPFGGRTCSAISMLRREPPKRAAVSDAAIGRDWPWPRC